MDHRLCLLFSLTVLAGSVLCAEEGVSSSALGCIDEMALPGYVGVLWMARVTGQATALISTGHTAGTPTSVKVETDQPVLAGFLKARLEKAKFLGSCADRTIQIKFKYILIGDPEEQPHSEFKLLHSDTIEIRARPPVLHTNI